MNGHLKMRRALGRKITDRTEAIERISEQEKETLLQQISLDRFCEGNFDGGQSRRQAEETLIKNYADCFAHENRALKASVHEFRFDVDQCSMRDIKNPNAKVYRIGADEARELQKQLEKLAAGDYFKGHFFFHPQCSSGAPTASGSGPLHSAFARTLLRRRKIPHFALRRKKIVPLFYRVSEIFLTPRKIL